MPIVSRHTFVPYRYSPIVCNSPWVVYRVVENYSIDSSTRIEWIFRACSSTGKPAAYWLQCMSVPHLTKYTANYTDAPLRSARWREMYSRSVVQTQIFRQTQPITSVSQLTATWQQCLLRPVVYRSCSHSCMCLLHSLISGSAAELNRPTAAWSGTPCRTTSAHSRTMSPLDRAWKPGARFTKYLTIYHTIIVSLSIS